MAEKINRNIGDEVLCEWDAGRITKHTITNKTTGVSQSGVMYQVFPAMKNSSSDHWIDSDWFYDPITVDYR